MEVSVEINDQDASKVKISEESVDELREMGKISHTAEADIQRSTLPGNRRSTRVPFTLVAYGCWFGTVTHAAENAGLPRQPQFGADVGFIPTAYHMTLPADEFYTATRIRDLGDGYSEYLSHRKLKKKNKFIPLARPFSRTIPFGTPQSASRKEEFKF